MKPLSVSEKVGGHVELPMPTHGSMRDRGDSVQGNPPPLEMGRQPGENRAAHRARLKRARRKTPNG